MVEWQNSGASKSMLAKLPQLESLIESTQHITAHPSGHAHLIAPRSSACSALGLQHRIRTGAAMPLATVC